MRIQVNSTDYTDTKGNPIVVIERGYRGGDWSVPAWEEIGCPELEGDVPEHTECDGRQYVIGWSWSSTEAAQNAVDAFRLEWAA